MEGEGNKLKGFIKERIKGIVSWICFGKEGLRIYLKGVETFSKEGSRAKRIIEWKENGRAYRLENRENEVRCFFLCSITEVKGTNFSFLKEGDS